MRKRTKGMQKSRTNMDKIGTHFQGKYYDITSNIRLIFYVEIRSIARMPISTIARLIAIKKENSI